MRPFSGWSETEIQSYYWPMLCSSSSVHNSLGKILSSEPGLWKLWSIIFYHSHHPVVFSACLPWQPSTYLAAQCRVGAAAAASLLFLAMKRKVQSQRPVTTDPLLTVIEMAQLLGQNSAFLVSVKQTDNKSRGNNGRFWRHFELPLSTAFSILSAFPFFSTQRTTDLKSTSCAAMRQTHLCHRIPNLLRD